MKKNISIIGLLVIFLFIHHFSNAQTSSTAFSFGVKIYGKGKPII